jgi:hypothetical protein
MTDDRLELPQGTLDLLTRACRRGEPRASGRSRRCG